MSDDDFGVQYTAPHMHWGASFHLPHQCDEWVIGEGDQAINGDARVHRRMPSRPRRSTRQPPPRHTHDYPLTHALTLC